MAARHVSRDTRRAMSQENIEIVRQFVLLDLEAALELADPDIVWNPVEEPPRQGHQAVRENLERWESGWEAYEATPVQFTDTGDRVVATLRIRGIGRGSGIAIDALFYEVYTLRGGKIVRMDEFTERVEALEAVGLSE